MAEQAIRDKVEEEDNKKREQEARAAQERLEAEKTRLRQEQMLQIQKQEANANKLLVYTKAMSLTFHAVSTICTNIIENGGFQLEYVVPVNLPLGNRTELHVLFKCIPQVLLASS